MKLGDKITQDMKLDLKSKNIAVLGFGIEGKDLVKYLAKHGAKITVFDEKEKDDLDFSGVNKAQFRLVAGKDYLKDGLDKYNLIFRSPGVYRYLPEIVKAEKEGAEISSATKLFFDLCDAKTIGVTGTKGKGTTSTLIYKILKRDGKDVYLAGNIGKPPLTLLPKLKRDSWVVMEMSSFQLIDLTTSPNIAVVLNITSDHMDWHKGQKEYENAKINIVRNQGENGVAVINADYQTSMGHANYTKGEVYYFSRKKVVKGAYVLDTELVLSCEDVVGLGNVNKLILRGRHNWENVAAAVCASYLAGAKTESIIKEVFSFKGLEHRLELVGDISGVSFYNDSFSTNSQTTMAAIKSFTEPITLILGGSDKNLDYDDLAKAISSRKNIRTVILVGLISQKLEVILKEVEYKGKIVLFKEKSFKNIASICLKHTEKGGVVLLSPATASFDMFESYKERGNKFKESVGLLVEKK